MRFSDFQVGDYVTFAKVLTAGHFEIFSELSGDKNKLHWDESTGARSQYGTTIAPIFLATAPFSAVAGMALPGDPSLILRQEFDAVRPIRYGEVLTYSARIEHCLSSKRALALSLVISAAGAVVVRGNMTTQCRSEEWASPSTPPGHSFEVRRSPRLAMVTGAAGAIGAATLRALAAADWEVWPVARTDSRIIQSNEPGAMRVRPTWIADFNDPHSVKALSVAVAAETPSLIVHCASAPYTGSVNELVATNFSAVESLSSACIPAFLQRQSGRIVYVGSIAQRSHPTDAPAYASVKEMTAHLLDGLNHRYGQYGVQAITLMPDLVRSSFGKGLSSVSGLRLEPEEVAAAIVSLSTSSSAAGRHVLDHRGLRSANLTSDVVTPAAVPTSQPNSPIPVGSRQEGRLRDRLREIFDKILPGSAGVADSALRLGEVEGWDSLGHIKLMVEIETRFRVSLAAKDISDITSFTEVLQYLDARLAVA